MCLCAPWVEYYLHKCIKLPNLDHQNLMNLISTTMIWAPKFYKTIIKLAVIYDFYKSMYVE